MRSGDSIPDWEGDCCGGYAECHRLNTTENPIIPALNPPKRKNPPEAGFQKKVLAGAEGFEPPTIGFGDRCSTNWNYAPAFNEAHYTN